MSYVKNVSFPDSDIPTALAASEKAKEQGLTFSAYVVQLVRKDMSPATDEQPDNSAL